MSSIRVTKHAPPPPPVPQSTYDITGLTEDEMWLIRNALANFRGVGRFTSLHASDLHLAIATAHAREE